MNEEDTRNTAKAQSLLEKLIYRPSRAFHDTNWLGSLLDPSYVKDTSQKIGSLSATQSLAEVGLGSLLHALHVPFTGHFLSLNQGLLLTLATRRSDGRREAIEVTSGMAVVVALLKTLSPAGKKLTPMLAIGTQGFLYSTGVAVFGANIFGACFGILLLSLWAFVQPLLIAWLLLGGIFFEAVEKLWSDLATTLSLPVQSGLWFLAGVVALKVLIAWTVASAAWIATPFFEKRYLGWLQKIKVSPRAPTSSPPLAAGRGALKDMLNPWFLASLALTLAFFFFSQHKSATQVIFYVLRTLAIAWLFFWALRSVPEPWLLAQLAKRPALAAAFDQLFRKRSRT